MKNEATFQFKGKNKTIDLEWIVDMDDIVKEFRDDELIPEDVTDAEASEQLVCTGVEGALAELFFNEETCFFDLEEFEDAQGDISERRGRPEKAIIAFIKWDGSWSKSRFQDCYCGQWKSLAAYAQDLAIDLGEISKDAPFFHHIDWDSYANELCQDYYYDEDSECVFRHM